jgi:uncharacterized protein (DUF58 family)
MDRHELFRRITTFPLIARGLSEDLLSGNFQSVFRGQGIEFDEVRHYEIGDDVRSIDWNVSARFGIPYVKMYREEREVTVCIILDGSASMHSGSGALSRYEQAVLAAALTALSAESSGQPVGAVFFDRGLRRIFYPRKGRAHVMAMISAALRETRGGRGSSLGAALTGAARFLKRRSMVVILSDFLCVGWEREMEDLSRKHDVAVLGITDPMDLDMPRAGLLFVRDRETGKQFHAPTGFSGFRAAWSEWHRERLELWKAICRRCGVPCMELSTAEDAAVALRRFFGERKRK